MVYLIEAVSKQNNIAGTVKLKNAVVNNFYEGIDEAKKRTRFKYNND